MKCIIYIYTAHYHSMKSHPEANYAGLWQKLKAKQEQIETAKSTTTKEPEQTESWIYIFMQ